MSGGGAGSSSWTDADRARALEDLLHLLAEAPLDAVYIALADWRAGLAGQRAFVVVGTSGEILQSLWAAEGALKDD